MTKVRLDIEMVQRGLCPSREKARALILAGEVRVNGIKADVSVRISAHRPADLRTSC